MPEATEPEHAEKALRASELRYRRLFETAQDGILILDAKTGQITDVNPFLVNLLGYSYGEFIGAPLWEIGLFKDTKECKLAFEELQEKEYIRYESLPLETKDGRSIAVEFVSNVYGLNRQPAGLRVFRGGKKRALCTKDSCNEGPFQDYDALLPQLIEAQRRLAAEIQAVYPASSPCLNRSFSTDGLARDASA